MRTFLFVCATRHEALAMAPLVRALKACGRVETKVCVTPRQRALFDPLLALFDISPDYELNPVPPGHAATDPAPGIPQAIGALFDEVRPDVVLVHGDTTTTLMASLAAFYRYLPVAHIDAGLRSGDISSPWPEELNRRLTDAVSTWHFAPTERARHNLFSEGMPADTVVLSGDTSIDALQGAKHILDRDDAFARAIAARYPFLAGEPRTVLVTGHHARTGDAFAHVCRALRALAARYRNVQFVYALQSDPSVDEPAHALLDGAPNIHVIAPQEYLSFVFLVSRAHFIITDSGNIQEEGPALGKPVLVTRETSARPEAIQAGTVRIVGVEAERIVAEASRLLDCDTAYGEMAHARNPYGDGHACDRIVHALLERPHALPSIASVGVGGMETPYSTLALGLHALRSA